MDKSSITYLAKPYLPARVVLRKCHECDIEKSPSKFVGQKQRDVRPRFRDGGPRIHFLKRHLKTQYFFRDVTGFFPIMKPVHQTCNLKY